MGAVGQRVYPAEPSRDRCDQTCRLQCQGCHVYESVKIDEHKMPIRMCTHVRAQCDTLTATQVVSTSCEEYAIV